MRVYVASSWRNDRYPAVRDALRAAGHEVYDWRDEGFRWDDVDPDWQRWELGDYLEALDHPRAIEGFNRDSEAMHHADAGVLLLPAGASAHLEAGWLIARGKPVVILMEAYDRPDLMYKLAWIVGSVEDVLEYLDEQPWRYASR